MKKRSFSIMFCFLASIFLASCGTGTNSKSFENAQKELNAGNSKNALELLLTAVMEDPTNVEAFFELGNVYTNLGEPEKAAVFYKKALELNDVQQNLHLETENLLSEQSSIAAPVTKNDETFTNTYSADENDVITNENDFITSENVIYYMVDNIFKGYMFEGQEISGLSFDMALSLLESRYPHIDTNDDYATVITGYADDGSGFNAVDDGNGSRNISVYTSNGGGISVIDDAKFGGGIQFLGAYNYTDGGNFNNVGKSAKDVLEEIGPGLYDAVKNAPADGNVLQWNNIQIMKFSEEGFQIMQGTTGYIIFYIDSSEKIISISVTLN